ncbi:Gfo/Idh/MocA family oxidoreductase [Streptomyces sp. NPDC051940]|uniref:Gfo/Idh/MocA family protein n=1 Tax=Streptomyces sp. NPDC051940 TaxID=3155675 RepID=UPI0034437124
MTTASRGTLADPTPYETSTAPFATVPGDEPLTVVIAGAGFMGRHWALTLAADPRVRIAGVADADPVRAERLLGELGLTGAPADESLGRLLGRTRPDFLVNCTTPAAHQHTTFAALTRAIPVLSEKPMAATLAESEALTSAASAVGRLLMVSQNRRYEPGVVALRGALPRLGRLSSVSVAHRRDHRPVPYVLAAAEPLMEEMAIHLFDTVRALTGTEAESAYCETFRTPWSRYAGNDSALAQFRMSGGLRFSFSGCWTSRGDETAWSGSWRFTGEHGTALWDGLGAPELRLDHKPPARVPCGRSDAEFPGLAEALDEFVTALRTGAPPQGECRDNLRSLAMVDAALASARTGTPVPVKGAL